MYPISYKQEETLLALAKYWCMTVQHLIEAGVSAHRTFIHRALNRLIENKLVRKQRYWIMPNKWKVHDIFYLTSAGYEAVLSRQSEFDFEAKLPNYKKPFSSDYFHRTEIIRQDICRRNTAARLWYKLLFCDRYFEWNHQTDKPATYFISQLWKIIPDMVMGFMNEASWYSEILIIEHEESQNVSLFLDKIKKYFYLLADASVNRKYWVSWICRVLFTIKSMKTIETLLTRANQLPSAHNFSDYILCKPHSEIMESGLTLGRTNLNMRKVNIIRP